MEDILKNDVEKIAKEFGLPEDKIKDIYQKEKEEVSLGAKIKDFISVIRWKKTRQRLGEFIKKAR